MTFIKFLASLLMLVLSATFVFMLLTGSELSGFSPFNYGDTLAVCIANVVGYSIMSVYYLNKHLEEMKWEKELFL